MKEVTLIVLVTIGLIFSVQCLTAKNHEGTFGLDPSIGNST